jgi:hypothetical protein
MIFAHFQRSPFRHFTAAGDGSLLEAGRFGAG